MVPIVLGKHQEQLTKVAWLHAWLNWVSKVCRVAHVWTCSLTQLIFNNVMTQNMSVGALPCLCFALPTFEMLPPWVNHLSTSVLLKIILQDIWEVSNRTATRVLLASYWFADHLKPSNSCYKYENVNYVCASDCSLLYSTDSNGYMLWPIYTNTTFAQNCRMQPAYNLSCTV
jgi:hypothetical protein